MKKALAQINPESSQFYEAMFEPVRRELNFLLEAFPVILAETIGEIGEVLGKEERRRLIEKIASVRPNETPFPLKGDYAIEMADVSLKEKVGRLPKFSRIALEIHAWKGNLSLANDKKSKPRRRGGFRGDRRFSPAIFPTVSAGLGYILNSFPEWYRQTLGDIPAETKTMAQQVMYLVRSDNHGTASHLLDARLQSFGGTAQDCPAFSRLCLEIAGSTYEKKTVQISPKIVPSLRDEIMKIFNGPANAGADFMMQAFARLYHDTVHVEIEPLFTDEEMRKMEKALKSFGEFNGSMAGTALRISLAGSPLGEKLQKLSPFGCACLEILLGQKIGIWNKGND